MGVWQIPHLWKNAPIRILQSKHTLSFRPMKDRPFYPESARLIFAKAEGGEICNRSAAQKQSVKSCPQCFLLSFATCRFRSATEHGSQWNPQEQQKRLHNRKKCLKCGVQHSNLAVVGRKSGYPRKANAETGIKRCWQAWGYQNSLSADLPNSTETHKPAGRIAMRRPGMTPGLGKNLKRGEFLPENDLSAYTYVFHWTWLTGI